MAGPGDVEKLTTHTAEGFTFLSMLFGYDPASKRYGKLNLTTWVEYLGKWGLSRALFVTMLFVGMLAALSIEVPDLGTYSSQWLVGTSPIWLPIALLVGAWKVWMWYVRVYFISKQKHILLEMKIPREITRSPRAMELALTNLWTSSGETTLFHRWWRGGVRAYYSFELASFGGQVHFYIWTRESDRNIVESIVYAQYPEVELIEVEDYASKFRYDPEKHMAFSTDYRLDPRSDAFPIKTYLDYELDKDPKEEYKIDPLAYVLEFLSSIKPNEQIWVQIILTLNKDKRRKKGTLQTEPLWESLVHEEVEKIRETASLNPRKKDAPDDDPRKFGFPKPTWAEQEQMKSMERHLGKYPFSVGMRAIYIGDKSRFHSPTYVGMRWLWRPFANPQYLNQLRPVRWSNTFDYPWQDFHRMRYKLHTRRFIDAFRRRSWFYTPWITPHNIMTAEAIASLWHPPSSSVTAPGIVRIPATKAEPPPNLPM
ncbi:MAG: hypothetical protein UY70_C0004G0013 [Candidatus Kaiserbacteria bacterium GW2011_GWB1_52_6]|uniref:Uncharacterized protein n=2 Tax=Candidatus Kaiseribacteriota TaxID=1752734 RepID=A0A0G1XH54_9BACT|nr:MAG: hypothetical protein UY70_C0004G0013 [Candidatus Kaiserbacteria bacterium GW2011_GWB1_52_6]KKW30286.1 MAG: hypothetical protein UY74_C0045G0002 [Candidatus Kaiserbacteria bacterium GW2011_GWC2_52_8b]